MLLKLILLLSPLCLTLLYGKSALTNDSHLDMDEAEFEEFFGLDPITDKDEFERRQNALKASEEEIKQINKEYEEGKNSWYDDLNDFSNLPKKDFLEQKTGLVMPDFEEESSNDIETYYARYKRSTVPDEYDARTEGLVSPVKNQKHCGSCAAFASMGCIETCFKKVSGAENFDDMDYSEQQLLDCALGQPGINGCGGAWPHAYLKWVSDNNITFHSENDYPYTSSADNSNCRNPPTKANKAKVSGYYHSRGMGDETILKNLVYEHGAVLVGINATNDLKNYRGGIFDGCIDSEQETINHAVVVVGYGTEDGTDYWLYKNSWGTTWGSDGFGKLTRGTRMCGIGPWLSHTECTKIADNESDSECYDTYKYCDRFTQEFCTKWSKYLKDCCAKSCNLC